MSFHYSVWASWKPTLLTVSSLVGPLFLLNIQLNTLDRAYAQATPPITSSGLNTTIIQNGNTYNITGGTRPGNGPNLFHSFGEFGIPTNNIANFLNETPNLTTSNILSRVTGGNPSNIFGTIQTTGFENANLFLMNPAGIVFGPHATLNVGGSVNFTTADYIRLADSMRFNAIPNAAADALLSAAPVAAFGFLGSNPGTITVQGSQLSVSDNQGISLVGGSITVQAGTLENGTAQPARLSAPGGQINVASVASPGEIQTSTFLPDPGISMGAVTLSQSSLLDASADAAGMIRIRSGQLVIADATLSADTVNAIGTPVAIDITATGDLSITDTRAMSAITARTSGTGDAGAVEIAAANVEASTSSQESFTLIDTHASGDGRAGNVTIATHPESPTGILTVTGTTTTNFFFIDSGTSGPGTGGDVSLHAKNIGLDQTSISTGDYVARSLFLEPSGSAGNLLFTGDSLTLIDSLLSTSSFAALGETQRAGDLTLNVRSIDMARGQIGLTGSERGGAITINADSLNSDFTFFETLTVFGQGGNITVNAREVELRNGSALISSTIGDGHAGAIHVTAADHVNLVGHTPEDNPIGVFQPSGLFSNSFGDLDFGTHGASGDIVVTTPRLVMAEGGRINTTTQSSGGGGNVTLNVSHSISISGEFVIPPDFESSIFDIGNAAPGGVLTTSVGSEFCSGVCGAAGHISISTGSLSLGAGGQIDSGTSNNGRGGDISIAAANTISLSGKMIDGSPSGIFSLATGTTPAAGSGGNIALTAGQSVSISDGASVSASSTGPGNAGNIAINAGQQFEMRNSSVKTEAAQASGGNIDIQAVDRVRLVNSAISTSVLGGSGSGGNITIDPNVVILQNSQVIAQAVQGAGGNITITTPLFLADAGSLVDASSQFGLSGTVNIQSPTSNLAGTVSSLPSSLRQVQSLQTGRCAALADSRSSSLIVAGRDILPAEPGGWSPSPFALMGEETDSLAIASPPVAAMIASADTPVSLRRLTPAGFLTQSFAENGLTGCRA